eukprot:420538_1
MALQRSIQTLFKRSQITKGELLTMTKLAGKDAMRIKPLRAFTNNIEIHGHSVKCLNHYLPVSSALKNDITLLQHNIELYNKNKLLFNTIYGPEKQIEINAYSISALKHRINECNIEYLQVSDDNIIYQCEEERELRSIFVLLEKYAHKFEGKYIQINSDNASVINMLNKYMAKPTKIYLQSAITDIASICMKYAINPYWAKIDAVGIFSDASYQH